MKKNTKRRRKVSVEHFFAADIINIGTANQQFAHVKRVDHLVLLSGSFIKKSILKAKKEYVFQTFNDRICSTQSVFF